VRKEVGGHPLAPGRETHASGKHRTEVTEGTEGDGLWRGVLWATPAAPGRKTRAGGKHRTEVTEGTEGGWAVAGCSLGDTGGFWARNTR
jgi:hypothetical protein